MPSHAIIIELRGNKHDPLCTEEVAARCLCGWAEVFCESCPAPDGAHQKQLGDAIFTHLLRPS